MARRDKNPYDRPLTGAERDKNYRERKQLEKSIKAETTETSTKPETREEPRHPLAKPMTVTERQIKDELILEKARRVITRDPLANGRNREFAFVVANKLKMEILPFGDETAELRARNEKIHKDLTRAKQNVTMTQ